MISYQLLILLILTVGLTLLRVILTWRLWPTVLALYLLIGLLTVRVIVVQLVVTNHKQVKHFYVNKVALIWAALCLIVGAILLFFSIDWVALQDMINLGVELIQGNMNQAPPSTGGATATTELSNQAELPLSPDTTRNSSSVLESISTEEIEVGEYPVSPVDLVLGIVQLGLLVVALYIIFAE